MEWFQLRICIYVASLAFQIHAKKYLKKYGEWNDYFKSQGQPVMSEVRSMVSDGHIVFFAYNLNGMS